MTTLDWNIFLLRLKGKASFFFSPNSKEERCLWSNVRWLKSWMPVMRTVSIFIPNHTEPFVPPRQRVLLTAGGLFTVADNAAGQGFNHLEFKIVVEPPDGQPFSVVLLAPSRQEKAAWTSDISQVSLTVSSRFETSRVKWFFLILDVGLCFCFSASITSDATAWWPACSRRTPKFLCRTWSSKKIQKRKVSKWSGDDYMDL